MWMAADKPSKMRQAILLVAALVVLGTVAGIPVVSSAENVAVRGTGAAAQTQAVNASTNVAPGERLSGVIGVQEAEVEGQFERHRFGHQIAAAATNTSKAGVLKAQLVNSRQRLNELAREKQRLQQARENGSISEGRFQAEMAQLAARTQTVKQLTNETERASRRIPHAVLDAKGVNHTAIQRLRQDAKNLSGPEVAAIARSIAGRNVGPRTGGGPPANVGPPSETGPPDRRGPGGPNESAPDDGENASAEAERAIRRADRQIATARAQVERARQAVNRSNASNETLDHLETAEAELTAAESALADARTAMEDGEVDEAIDLAETTIDHAETAADEARSALMDSDGQRDDEGAKRGSESSGNDPGSGNPGQNTEGSESQ